MFSVPVNLLAVVIVNRTNLLLHLTYPTGCLPFGSRSRRHAWEKSDGFKLGGLLDRDRNGFEKLDQQASDEEQDTTTTLASAQYA